MKAETRRARTRAGRCRRGSVIVIVLVTVALAAWALHRLIERAAVDVMVSARTAREDELRVKAYSALQTTLAVLREFHELDGALYSTAQGWGNPLELAGWSAAEREGVSVQFEDESGRIPMRRVTADAWEQIFEKQLSCERRDAQLLARSLLDWTQPAGAVEGARLDRLDFDYERQPLPYQPPHRPLRSFSELRLIRGFEHLFFGPDGAPNERYHQFTRLVSRFDFDQVNINSASPAVLESWLGLSPAQAADLDDRRTRPRKFGERGYFKSLTEASGSLTSSLGRQPAGAAIQILRVTVRVRFGGGEYPLHAVLRLGTGARSFAAGRSPDGGSGQPDPLPPPEPENGGAPEAAPRRKVPSGDSSAAELRLNGLPFPLLEIQEGRDSVPLF